MKKYDVIVIGAGSAGVIAALASARTGAHTLLIEESSTVGGTNTNSLVGPLVPFLGENGLPIVGGIPQEIIDELMAVNATTGHRKDPIGFAHSLTPVDFKMLQVVQTNLLLKQDNLDVVFNQSVVGVQCDERMIKEIQTVNRLGETHHYQAHTYIDSSGDADVIALAGGNVEVGRESDGKVQPMTMVFSLANVDLDRVRDDVAANPENFAVSDDIAQGERMDYVAVSGYFNEVRNSPSFPIERDRLLFFEGVQPGEVYVNTTRVLNKSALNPEEYNEATLEGNRQVLSLYKWMRESIPAFKDATLMDVGVIGVRESRRIVGRKQLKPLDVLSGAKQEKSIAVGSYPIDVHSPDSAQMEFIEENIVRNYEIDYDMIIPNNLDNVLVAGRAISATHEAHASSRVSVTCMAIGQAAGVAAAIAANASLKTSDVPYAELEQTLVKMQAIINR